MATLVTESGRKTPARLAGSALLAMQSDERLVQLVRDGHERAFDAIVSRYRPALTRFCGRILPESRTEDAVQQAFINAHAALQNGEEPQQLRAWLYTITRNSALNMLRQNGWNYEQIPLDFDGVRRPDQVVDQRIELQETVAAVGALPNRQRDALVMREFEGRSYEEIALALGANDGAVRQLLNRARGTLRTALSALVPPPIVARAASSMPPADGRRFAEVLASVGAGGAVKVGATALVAGSLVVGAVKAPLPLAGDTAPHRDKATLTAGAKASKAGLVATAVADPAAGVAGDNPNRGLHKGAGRHGRGGSAPGHRNARSHGRSGKSLGGGGGPAPALAHGRDGGPREHSGSGETHHSGSGGEDRSGSTRSGSDDHSGSSDGLTRDGGGTETSGGSDDPASLSGTDGGGSDTSGSGDSGSGSSTSGSDDGLSGSGSSGSDGGGSTTTTTSSGSSDSGSTLGSSGPAGTSLDDH